MQDVLDRTRVNSLPRDYQLIRKMEMFCEDCQEVYDQLVFIDPSGLVGNFRTPCHCSKVEVATVNDDGNKIERDIGRLFKGRNLLNPNDEVHKEMSLKNFIPEHSTQRKALTYLLKFKPGSKGVILFGGAGRGKTHLGIGLVRKLQDEGRVCLALKSIDMLNRIRKTYRNNDDVDEIEVINLLKQVEILFIDDIGVEKPSGWVLEKLYEIIDYRTNRRTTIFTTNLDGEEMKAKLGPALVSRIYGVGEQLEIEGKDRRVQLDMWSDLGTEVDV